MMQPRRPLGSFAVIFEEANVLEGVACVVLKVDMNSLGFVGVVRIGDCDGEDGQISGLF